MRHIISFGFFLIIFFLSNQAYGQNFEWLNAYVGKVNKGFRLQNMSAEPNGGCSFIVNYAIPAKPDTFTLGSYKRIFNNSYATWASFIVRLDSSGNVKKVRFLAESYFEKMSRDDKGNFYVEGLYASTFDSVSLNYTDGTMILAKYDTDLNRVWLSQTGGQPPTDVTDGLFFSGGHLFFNCIGKGTTKVGSTTFNLYNVNNYIYGEIDQSNGKILWSNNLYNSSDPDVNFNICGIQYLKGNIYIAGSNYKDIKVGKSTFYKGGTLVQLDSVGRYKKSLSVPNLLFNCITTDGEYFYLGAIFNGMIYWKGKYILPQSYGGYDMCIVSIGADFKQNLFFTPHLASSIKAVGMGNFVKISTNEGYIYFTGYSNDKILFGSNTIPGEDLFIGKMDYLGNTLWVTNGSTNGKILGIDAIAGKYVFVGGVFEKKISFGKFSSNGNTFFNGWILKVSDNSILRGDVRKGPYCAGDTIKVPYIKNGDYDTSNYFIAELSNEEGNFDTGGKELGRIKSTKSDTVIGSLPMFQVSSSKNYRIRIRSTNPPVQSFFRIDTLRLLIYSRDKANPGKPESICYGDTIQLSTFGGTKWKWSPQLNMNDSTLRQPLVWPKISTTYKIIIADSSGCGKADTAFKEISVRKPLKISLAYSDTMICNNSKLQIPVKFSGGDSTNYHWQLFIKADTFTGKWKTEDTIHVVPFTDSTGFQKLTFVLNDGCTNKADTAYLTIGQRKPITITTNYRDTNLCTGNVLNYRSTAKGGVPRQYRYQWTDLLTNSIISTADTLKILTKKSLKIQLIVNDGCEALGDTAKFDINVKPPLKTITNLRDTTICEGKLLNYTAKATGGDSKVYKFYWVLNGKQIDTINYLQLTLNNTSNVLLITKDNCSPSDSIKSKITVHPSPKADFTWDLACSRTITKFQFTGTKPNSPVSTQFHWNFNNEATSNLETPSHKFASAGTSTTTLIIASDNGCKDTLKKTIEIKPQANANFTTADGCETDSASFKNLSQDATSYLWKFGDGQKSTKANPKHKYQIASTTTYNVTLVAQVTNGCADSMSKAVTINQNPSSDFSYTYNGNKVDLKIAKGGNSYQWKFGTTDSLKTTTTTYTHTIKSTDQHTVCLIATDVSGCSSQTCKNVTVGILNLSEKSFKIFPNPNNGTFTIEIENPKKDISIEVYNLIGELVGRVERAGVVTLIDLDAEPGMYFVKVKNGDVNWNQKVFVSFGTDTN